MSNQLSKSFRPSLESLEDRNLMATGLLPDLQLTAVLRSTNPYDPAMKQVYVDGSIYDDRVEVLQYATGANGFVTLKLEQWNGATRVSSRIVTINTPNLKFNGWAVEVDLKEGNDQLFNNTAAPMAARGGSGNDVMYGGSAYDFLQGGPGSNVLYGRDGGDAIYGGDGQDAIYGGGGSDILRGYGGNDWIIGDDNNNAGNDIIQGGTGDDTLVGGAGYDEMYGEQGNDWMFGGADGDWMWGGDGNDYMYGEAGSDRLNGDGGLDRLYGGADNDYLNAGYYTTANLVEPEYLEGGQGADQFVRHKSVFRPNDNDVFADYSSAAGDRVITDWHW